MRRRLPQLSNTVVSRIESDPFTIKNALARCGALTVSTEVAIDHLPTTACAVDGRLALRMWPMDSDDAA